jgi:threonine aldolase
VAYSFTNDYSEGAHPEILDALVHSNAAIVPGYERDPFCAEAAALIKKCAGAPEAAVHFVTGGTQANLVGLVSMLRSYESVIAVRAAHISVHEAGAIEATGHKIHECSDTDGKLLPETIQHIVDTHTDEHMVKPRVVFLSQSTELGTAYTKEEMDAIRATCQKNGLYLYADGARLGSALTAQGTGMDLRDFASRVDMFSIGGTKNGGLLGEAIVIMNPKFQDDFRYHMKQRGALSGKSRVLGAQFVEFFRDGLYFKLGNSANVAANRLEDGLTNRGIKMYSTARTNQRFPILPKRIAQTIERTYGFYIWTELDSDHVVIRLVTSWATKTEAVEEFLADLDALM